MVLNVVDGTVERVTDSPWADWVPTWSPDGAWIAWASESPKGEIMVRHLASGFEAQLTTNGAQDWRPVWRPVLKAAE